MIIFAQYGCCSKGSEFQRVEEGEMWKYGLYRQLMKMKADDFMRSVFCGKIKGENVMKRQPV